VRRHVETVARASRLSVAMSDDSRGVRLEMDAYAGSAERPIRAFASTSTSASVGSEEDARPRPSSWDLNGDVDERHDARWVVYSGRNVRGRVRIVSAAATTGMVLEKVTVEWLGRERVGETTRLTARSPAGELARAVTLEPGTSVSFKFGIDLPPGLPPSFTGEASRYWYCVSCKATTASGEHFTVTAPLTVRASEEEWDFEEGDEELCRVDDSTFEDTSYSARDLTAPWIHVEDTVPPESPRFNGSLPSPRALTPFQLWTDVETPRREPIPSTRSSSALSPSALFSQAHSRKSKSYVVNTGAERLLKVTLRKPAPKCTVGCEVAGILDFTCASPGGSRVSKIMITLESDEIIHADAQTASGGKPPVFNKIWVETTEHVEHLDVFNFAFNLPACSPGGFRTSKVELKWFLRFDITSVRRTRAGEFAAFFKGEQEKSEFAKTEWILPLDVGSGWFGKNQQKNRSAMHARIVRDSSLVAMPY